MAAMSSVPVWRTVFLVFRFTFYALFVIFNAIICCAAVWNLSFSLTGTPSHLDAYLIFVGAFGLSFVFPVIFIDVFRRHALTSRVWFEIFWTGIFWILELAAASAISVQAGADPCDVAGDPGILTLYPAVSSACRSTNVLLAFTWIMATLCLCHFAILLLLAVFHHERFADVWHSGVGDFPWFTEREPAPYPDRRIDSLEEQKITPYTERVPQPRRVSSLRNAVNNWRHYVNPDDRPESVFTQPLTVMEHELPASPPPAVAAPERTRSPPALYPEQVQFALRAIVWDQPADGQPTVPQVTPLRLRTRQDNLQPPPSIFLSPSGATVTTPYTANASPLGDWPNAHVMQQPLQPRRKRQPPPTAFSTAPLSASDNPYDQGYPQGQPLSRQSSASSQRPNTRPTGPRGRTASMSSDL